MNHWLKAGVFLLGILVILFVAYFSINHSSDLVIKENIENWEYDNTNDFALSGSDCVERFDYLFSNPTENCEYDGAYYILSDSPYATVEIVRAGTSKKEIVLQQMQDSKDAMLNPPNGSSIGASVDSIEGEYYLYVSATRESRISEVYIWSSDNYYIFIVGIKSPTDPLKKIVAEYMKKYPSDLPSEIE